MKTLLITAIGGDIGQGIARIVREAYPSWRIIGTDIHLRHGGSLFVDKYVNGLSASDPKYIDRLSSIVQSESVDICLPTMEVELLRILDTNIRKIGDANLLMPSETAVRVGTDKLETAQFIAKIGLPVPWTIPVELRTADTKYPCIFKPRLGGGSKGVFVCNSESEAVFLKGRFPNSVLQELLLPSTTEITCVIYRTRLGETSVLQLLRQLASGMSSWVEVVEFEEVTRQCIEIAESLDLCGSINVQMILTESGPRIFEINPRFSSTVLMRHRLGFCDAVWAIEECLGHSIYPRVPVAGCKAVRTMDAAISK